jgi:hypothetical protein
MYPSTIDDPSNPITQLMQPRLAGITLRVNSTDFEKGRADSAEFFRARRNIRMTVGPWWA